MIIRVSILSLFVLIRLTIFCHGHLMKISDQNRSSERETSSENMPAKLHESSTDIQTSELSITSQFHGQWFPDALPRNNLWTNPFSVLQTTISYPHLNSSKTTPQICQYCSLAELFYNDACTEWPVKKFKTSNRPKEPSSEEISYPGEKFPININVSEDLEERHVFDYYGKVFRRLTCLNGFQFKDEYCVYADINSTLNVKATLIINQNPLIGKRKEYSRKQLFRIAQLLYKTFSVFKLSRILHIAIYQNLLNTSELN
ncbi:uncharacterized protein LOC134268985, partial [Saccostrea cucullata]|uniref:uncharacterized protein LOC134268985 n=1 Tax=Saccostrea cuccullata TaxID=36930 RepID=UPI002ED2DAAD